MNTTLRINITVADICDGFVYNQLEGKGLFGLGGKLTSSRNTSGTTSMLMAAARRSRM